MRSLLLLGATGGLFAVGCATPMVDGPDAEATSSTATAIVVVERSTGPGEAVRADAVFARFIRVRQGAVDDSALRIAGVSQDIPAAGTCAAQKEVEPAFGARVELLDVGAVTLDGSDRKSTVLGPRTMPDPAGFVSGVFYATRSADVMAPGGAVSLHTSGSKDVPAFAVTAVAPREIGDVRAVSLNGGIDVQWDADQGSDLVYVDVLSPAPRVVVRCASELGAGRLVIPAAYAGAIEEGQIAVHRVHREKFSATGIEPGEVRFDLAKVVAYRR